jgi:uncharacterized damage-inducible protein DinB
MTSPDILTRMYAHMAWADQRTLKALHENPDSPSQALELFSHVLTAEHIWLRRLEGVPSTYAVFQPLGLEECAQLAQESAAGFARVLANDTRSRPVSYRTSAGVPHTTPVDDILIHVSHHGMYHRGQVALLIRAAGGVPISSDYIVYFRELVAASS